MSSTPSAASATAAPDRSAGSGRPHERSDALIMFGLSGDLGEKKLFPALVELAADGRLDLPVIAVGRTDLDDDTIRARLEDAVADHPARDHADRVDLSYVTGDGTDPGTFDEIVRRLDGCERPTVYAAVPPAVFGDLAGALASSPLPDTTRLVIEKPFGHDADSARELYREITEHVDDQRLFAVDHFLAKASVENLLTFRAANPMIDAVMHRERVERVEVTMAEAFGVDGRGSFYESVGAIADVVQNHLLQLVAVLLMEPPADDSDDAYDTARSELLRAIDAVGHDDAVLGQYAGYRDLDDVADDSGVETYAALRLRVEGDRWRGVPVVIRTGKQLAGTTTEAIVQLAGGTGSGPPNRFRFRFKPATAIDIELGMLDTDDGDGSDADGHGIVTRRLSACAPNGHGMLGDYATMLDGALDGDHRHFARIDDIEAAWRIVDPLRAGAAELLTYERGSMGPAAAGALALDGAWLPLTDAEPSS
jgi:glucose-6-phosphate 1-dehydrogenase